MKRSVGLALTLLVASTLMLIFNPEIALAQSTRLYIDPPSIIDPTLTPGQSFTVDVKISDVEFLYAWQVNMSFDSNVLTFVNVTEGDFLKDQPEGTFGAWRIEESWALFAWTTIGAYQGVSGNGTLATVEFNIKTVGESILKFEFGDPNLTYLIGQQQLLPPPDFYDIEFSVDGGYFSNIILAIYTDQYFYTTGSPMDLGLQLI